MRVLFRSGFVKQGTIDQQHKHKKQGQASRTGQSHRQAGTLVQSTQRRWPCIVGIGLHPYSRHGLGHIDGKLVRWSVLAGMQTGAAVMAQVCQVMDIGLAELQQTRSEEHTSELQSLMRTSYAVF